MREQAGPALTLGPGEQRLQGGADALCRDACAHIPMPATVHSRDCNGVPACMWMQQVRIIMRARSARVCATQSFHTDACQMPHPGQACYPTGLAPAISFPPKLADIKKAVRRWHGTYAHLVAPHPAPPSHAHTHMHACGPTCVRLSCQTCWQVFLADPSAWGDCAGRAVSKRYSR